MLMRPNVFLILFLLAAVVALGAAVLFYGTSLISSSRQAVYINDAVVRAEVVMTPDLMKKGLSGRPSLAQDEGMLFVYPEAGEYSFWMHGMLFPIDIIWILDNQVIGVSHDLQPVPAGGEPVLYSSPGPANRVLEVNAGFTQKHYIEAGDEVQF